MGGSGEDEINIFLDVFVQILTKSEDQDGVTWLSHGSGLVNILQADGDFGRVRRIKGKNQGIENTNNDVDHFVFGVFFSKCILGYFCTKE